MMKGIIDFLISDCPHAQVNSHPFLGKKEKKTGKGIDF
jgi:hypothetical protein